MTIPRLPGLFDEIQPGLQGFQQSLQQLFRPDLPAQQALKQQLIQDPSVVAAIQNMNPQEREAYLNTLGLKNQGFRNNILSMPLGQKAQLEDMKMKALNSLSPDERTSALTGSETNLQKRQKQASIASSESETKVRQTEIETAAREAGLRARRDAIIKSYKGNSGQLYKDYIGGKLQPDDLAAISNDKGLSAYFEKKAQQDFNDHQLSIQMANHELNRQATRNNRELIIDANRQNKEMTIAAAMATAAGQPGSIQEFIAIQDPANRKKAFDASDLRRTNPQAFNQAAQVDNSLIGLADAADGLKQISAQRKNNLTNPIKDRLLRAENDWNTVIKNPKSKPEELTGSAQTLEANVQDALQTLATINGQSIQVKVHVTNPERHLLSKNVKAGIQVELAGPGYTTQPISLQQAQDIINKGGSSNSTQNKQVGGKTPEQRFDEIQKSNPKLAQQQILDQMKKEGFKF